MILGVLYLLFAAITAVLWARTNFAPQNTLNVWRFFLIEAAIIGALVCHHQEQWVYWLAFGCLMAAASVHTMLFLRSNRGFGWLYVAAIYISITCCYWMLAWFMSGDVKTVGPLGILVPGLFLTYTAPGRRLWSKYFIVRD